ncbi:MAG: NAD-dependent succinate-semialdehyde dehydrogenase [Pseudomonadota bacterium]
MQKKMYIDGQLVDTPNPYEVINPATEQAIGTIAWASELHAQQALKAAEKAFDGWAATSVAERAQWMLALREEVIKNEEHLRECIHMEMGKTWEQTQEDFDSLVNSLAFYAEEITRVRPESIIDREATHTHDLVPEPVGVVVAVLAWNFPLLNLAFKIGPAMATGCPIIIKPSFKSPLSAYAVGELCAKIDLPAGVVNIICGQDEEVGDALTSSKIPALVTLIGSSRTGMHMMRMGATSIKRYSMELGGNAPVLVFDDADLDLAADIVCAVKFGNAGQICVTPNRVYVHENIMDTFIHKTIERAKNVQVGFDRKKTISMGPLIDAAAWQRVDGLVRDAVADGARIEFGGGRPDGIDQTGHFYAPTILSGVTNDMRIWKEEIFGPVVSLIEFTDEDAVLKDANDTPAGLTAYVFSRDLDKAQRCARRLRFGEIQINGVKYAIDLPHGGMKQSGMGYDCSHLALDDYLTLKRVSRALTA